MQSKDVKIAAPCTLDWRKMTPAEGGRFCGDCKKVVRDLSKMTEREARKLLKTTNGGELCVRYIYDDQGRIFFGADAPRPDQLLSASSLLHHARRAAAAAAVVALPFATQACDSITEPLGITSSEQRTDDDVPPGYHENMGGAPPPDYPDHAIEGADASPDASPDAKPTSHSDGGSDAAPNPNEQDGGADSASAAN